VRLAGVAPLGNLKTLQVSYKPTFIRFQNPYDSLAVPSIVNPSLDVAMLANEKEISSGAVNVLVS
jgi:hypothetical protein